MTSGEARALGVEGDGAATDGYTTNDLATLAACRWGSTDGRGNSVDAQLSIWRRQEAADAQWRVVSTSQTTPLKVGDDGFITDETGAVVVRTRYGNAVVTVRLVGPADDPDQLPRLREAAPAITSDVLDDLVAQ